MKKLLLIFCLAGWSVASAQHPHTHSGASDEHDHEHHLHLEHHHEETGALVSHRFVGVAPRMGVSWQQELYAEVGMSLDFYDIGYYEGSEYLSFAYSNLRPYLSGEVMLRGDKIIGGPKAGVEFIILTNGLGMAFGADATWYTDGVRNALAVTPRLMLSFVYVELYYGYNFLPINELQGYIGRHRIGVSCTLNPRFWRRKKAMYNDYYNSYL
jgi:hypothetical protein